MTYGFQMRGPKHGLHSSDQGYSGARYLRRYGVIRDELV